jgi:hypothetical protein
MHSLGIVLLISMSCLLPFPAAAGASDTTAPLEEVIVQGQGRDALKNFVSAMAETGITEQLSRWKRNICPAVYGVTPEAAALIIERIVDVALLARLTPAEGNCRPTMNVLITDNADEVAAVIVENYPTMLQRGVKSKLKRFAGSDLPVRWLSVIDPCGYGCIMPNSRLKRSTTPTLVGMLIIVDAMKTPGFTVNEIADYVALVALTNPKPDTRHSHKSILSMFDRERAGTANYALTDYDQAFLTGLYNTSPDRDASQQRKSIVKQMESDLEPDRD